MSSPQSSLVFNFVAQDKLGIVETLAACVKRHGGNWHESRLVHLNGLFSGLVNISLPSANQADLQTELTALSSKGISVQCMQELHSQGTALHHGTIEIVGPDRTGIVHEISLAMVEHGINIERMETAVSSAAMSGEAMFTATMRFSSATEINDKLHDDIDTIAEQLTLDISLLDSH